MKKSDITYKYLQGFVKDKDKSVNLFIDRTLAMLQSMFHYDGLPETIPPVELERILMQNGVAFVTEVDGKLYALYGNTGGEYDEYLQPTKFVVANTALNLFKEYDIKSDGVLMRNDTNGASLYPLIGKYAVLYTDGVISLNTATVLSRITMLISASDDKTRQSADVFLQKIADGEFSVIGENSFYKGVQMQTGATSNANYITQLIELVQYIKANLCQELGLNSNYNMKRERLTSGETQMNVDILLPYVDNMLSERQQAVQAINEKYGTNIQVHLKSSWLLEQENAQKILSDTDTDISDIHEAEIQEQRELQEQAEQESNDRSDNEPLATVEPIEQETEQPEQETEQPEQPEKEKEKDYE